jgi:hypothetical protein
MGKILIYKSIGNGIATLEMDESTRNNMNRKGIDNADFAQYRCEKAKVLEIEDKDDPSIKYDYIYSDYIPLFKYEVGKEVIAEKYDEDGSKHSTTGIHFYKTKEAAWHHNKLNFIPMDCKNTFNEKVYFPWSADGSCRFKTNLKLGGILGLQFVNGKFGCFTNQFKLRHTHNAATEYIERVRPITTTNQIVFELFGGNLLTLTIQGGGYFNSIDFKKLKRVSEGRVLTYIDRYSQGLAYDENKQPTYVSTSYQLIFYNPDYLKSQVFEIHTIKKRTSLNDEDYGYMSFDITRNPNPNPNPNHSLKTKVLHFFKRHFNLPK